jgi:8-oxo-dGTP pyrophosphatase MutT (NUDIX family)
MKKYRSVAAIAVEREGKWLLVRKPRKENAWQFPQGGVDEGESFVQAAERELREECGANLKIKFSPEPVAEYRYDFPADFLRHNGEFLGANVLFFQAKHISGEPKVDNEEIVEARWCTQKEIKDLVEEEYWEILIAFI